MIEAAGLQYRTLLHDELKDVRTLMLEACSRIPDPIRRPIELLINSGGKQLRPALVILYAKLAPVDTDKVLLVAAGVEMLHTATLIHDDLIDNAQLRRGVGTVNQTWSPTATVLAGDALFAMAAKLIAQTDNTTMAYRFSETLESICTGELRQMLSKNGHLPTIEAYYERIFAKTASLFALCAESGPILSGLEAQAVTAGRRFGKLLGEAFQIADDVLDITGTPQSLGKPVGADLQGGLVTLPVIVYAQDHADDARLRAALRREADDATISALAKAIRAEKAEKIAMQRAEAHIEAALAILHTQAATPYRDALEEIAHFAIRRQY